MNKTIKGIAIALAMGLMIISLTACGADKLVATKTTEDDLMGNYKEEIIFTFKNDKVDTVKMSMEFDKEETAKSMYSLYSLGMSMSEEESLEGFDVKQDGKKLVITMDASMYAEQEDIDAEELTKESLKAQLEDAGYTVK